MSITSVSIQNYQAHKNTTLNFPPGVSAIIGQSDSGKTSILRAMRWVIENRPGGDAFRSSWGGKTSVKITTGQNVIERVKDKTTVNTYSLSTGKEELTFAAMGTHVPEEVKNALNINSINAQYQLDRPFLLDSSPGEVAAHFNRIAHLDIIDVGLRNVKSWISGLTKTISIEETRLMELEEEQSQYDYLPAMEKEIVVLEALHSHLHKMSEDFIDFEKLRLSIIKTDSKIGQYTDLLALELAVHSALKQMEIISDKKEKVENFVKLTWKIQKTEKRITAGNSILNLEKHLIKTLVLIQKEKAIQNEKRLLTGVVSGIKTTILTLKTKIARRDELQTQFDENFPDTCPLCGRSD